MEDVMQHAPLSRWQAQLQTFIYDCAASAPHEEPDRIREARLLLLSLPNMSFSIRPDFPVEARLEAMLDCDAVESAALSLLGKDDGVMLSRGPNGTCLATAILPGREDEVTAEGATLALALIAAQAKALLISVPQIRPS